MVYSPLREHKWMAFPFRSPGKLVVNATNFRVYWEQLIEKEGMSLAHQNESIGKWFSIIHRYNMMYKSRSFRPYGIGAGQLDFLSALYQKDGISQDELAHELNIDKTTTARSIRKLEELGFVTRHPSEQDRRINLIFLTQKSQEIYHEILSTMRVWTDILMQGFSEEEREQLLHMLKRVSDNAVDYISGMEEGGDE